MYSQPPPNPSAPEPEAVISYGNPNDVASPCSATGPLDSPPNCCLDVCLDDVVNSELILSISNLDNYDPTSPDFFVAFEVCYYENFDFAITPVCDPLIYTSPSGNTVPGEVFSYPYTYPITNPGYYFVSAELWQDTDGDGRPDIEIGTIGPGNSVLPACIHILDDTFDINDIAVDPQQQTYCIDDNISFSLNTVSGYEGITWYLDGEEQFICNNIALPTEACEEYVFTPTEPGVYIVSVEAGNICTNATLFFTIVVEPCCTITDVVDTPDELTCCLWDESFDVNEDNLSNQFDGRDAFVVSNSGTWTSASNEFITTGFVTAGTDPIRLDVDLVIPTGVNLIIDDMNFIFGIGRRILVSNGASLTINHGSYTGLCNTMWQGIQVQGGIGNVKGQLFITNEAIISNAFFGVITTTLPVLDVNNINTIVQAALIDFDPVFNISATAIPNLWNFATWTANSGGIVSIQKSSTTEAFSCQFNNCFIGAYVTGLTETVAPVQYIGEADFTSDASLPYPFQDFNTETGVHVLTTDQIVEIDECTFTGLKYGNRVIDAKVDVHNNYYNRCTVGFSARNFITQVVQDVELQNNDFMACQIAAQVDAGSVATIENNTVNKLLPTDPFWNTDPYGLENSLGFYCRGSNVRVINNEIYNVAIGMAITDLHQDGSRISGNYFDKLNASQEIFREAIISQGDNSNVAITCNHFLSYRTAGIDIRQWGTAGQNAILANQGRCDFNEPAANTFIGSNDPGNIFGYWIADIVRDATAVSDFEYDDVGASFLSVEDDSDPTFQVVLEECTPINLDVYCANQGFTPLSDINLITDDIKRNQALSRHLHQLLADGNYTDALLLIYDYNSSMTQRMRTSHEISQGNTASAQTRLNSYPENTDEDVRYKQYHQLQIDLVNAGKQYYEIDQAQEDLLYDIADSKTRMAYYAQAWLYVVKGQEFAVTIPAVLNGNSGVTTAFKVGETQANAYPNPARDKLYIPYNITDNQTATISIYNIQGKLINTANLQYSGTYTLHTEKLLSGIYFYEIRTTNNEVLIKEKVSVVK